MNQTPENLKFTATHEWINDHASEMQIGITAHAQELLGDLVFVELPDVGREITAGEEIGVVESVKAASDFYAPISGVIVAINTAVTKKPELINQDPYGAGWLVKIKPTDATQASSLLNAQQYQEVIAKDH